MARSRWEAGIRHIIGGGELESWLDDNTKYRGGGNLYDALLLLADADDVSSFESLSSFLSLEEAREILGLEIGLSVPDGPSCCVMKHFNDEATAGPVLRAFGVKGKYGLKHTLEAFVWEMYDMAGTGELSVEQLPPLLARVGYRSKLLDIDAAFEKMRKMKPLGRAVMMLDAVEQAFSSPVFNVISDIVTGLNRRKESGWRNYLIRASSAWGDLWDEVKESGSIVELDWSKFDRERPRQDIQFFVDIIISCFEARSERETRLLAAYKKMMENALVNRVMMLDDGTYILMDGMVPSGSLWTGICDTALNIMYITVALLRLGFKKGDFSPKCAGDDNLTLFKERISRKSLGKLRLELNRSFRAGIEKKDFIVHYPEYHVEKEQAVFPLEVDISKGTSKLKDQAIWLKFEGELNVDEAQGYSHRWQYVFRNKPKFLANYFLPDGRPIRPVADNLERLLWPEGIHDHIDDYKMAVMAMVVDNPFNHHNVNKMMIRYLIACQIERVAYDVEPELVMELCAIRPDGEECVPYPGVASWRRGYTAIPFEEEHEFAHIIGAFKEFVSTASTLYTRRSEGGIDTWRFMNILRGESSIGANQFGNDILRWCRFLGNNPLTKSLRAARRFHQKESFPVADEETLARVSNALMWCRSFCQENSVVSSVHFASEISNILKGNVPY